MPLPKITSFVFAYATLAGAITLGAHAAERPNILYIMSDDHTSQAIGAYGSHLAQINPTPHIDQLAKEGVRLDAAFVSNSICTPSRATLITGQYSHVNHIYILNQRIRDDQQVLAQEIKKAGYQTAMIGKWHLDAEPSAFDYYKVLPGQGKYHNPEFNVRGEQSWPKNRVKHDNQHVTDVITDTSIEWLKNGRDKSKPFFLMHHFKAPHDMFENAERYDSYLADVTIPEPPSINVDAAFGSIATRGYHDELIHYLGTSIGRRNYRRNYTQLWAQDDSLSDQAALAMAYQTYLKKYLRCVKGVDDNMGRLLTYLKDNDLLDNTVIIYTSDQGMMLGEHDYIDKRWMYEESMRVPFIVRYPKTITAGSTHDALISNVDFAPTLLDFAGVKTPPSMQGRSFRSLIETGKTPDDWRTGLYYRYWMHLAHHDNPAHFGIRTKTHKLIFYYGCGMNGERQTPPAWELYDLVNDPHETRNIYDDPTQRPMVTTLKNQLATLRKEVGDEDQDFPDIKHIVDEFWDYDEADRERAKQISAAYLKTRHQPSEKN